MSTDSTASFLDGAAPTPTLQHLALLYRDPDEYVRAATDFLLPGLGAGDRILVMAPHRSAEALGIALASHRDSMIFTDMQVIGRNPARIMPVLEAFIAEADGRARIISEAIWPGRSDAEIREVFTHEALTNLAFAGTAATIICSYDARRLPATVIAGAQRTHPFLSARGGLAPSPAYQGPMGISAEYDLPSPPGSARVIVFRDDLRAVRTLVADQAGQAGLRPVRAADLVLAVSELAANTLVHTMSDGTLSVWRTADEVVCQVDDAGFITDPLAGRRLPHPGMTGGHGLWLVNQCCDLTQVCTRRSGTTIRLHMRLADDP